MANENFIQGANGTPQLSFLRCTSGKGAFHDRGSSFPPDSRYSALCFIGPYAWTSDNIQIVSSRLDSHFNPYYFEITPADDLMFDLEHGHVSDADILTLKEFLENG